MHIVLIDIYVYASIVPVVHFNTITKGTVRCFVQFLYHSSAKMTEHFLTIAVLQLNMRALAF